MLRRGFESNLIYEKVKELELGNADDADFLQWLKFKSLAKNLTARLAKIYAKGAKLQTINSLKSVESSCKI